MSIKRYLFDLFVQKISLVSEPANRRKFFLVKRAKGGDVIVTEELKKMVTKVFGEEKAEDYIKAMEAKSEEELAEISKSVETLSACADDLPEDLRVAITSVVSAALSKSTESESEETEEEDAADVAKSEAETEEASTEEEAESTEESESVEETEEEASPADELSAYGDRIEALETEIQSLKKAMSDHSMKEQFEEQLETVTNSIGDLKDHQQTLADRVEKMANETPDETSIGAEETRKSTKKSDGEPDWTAQVFEGIL